MVPTSECGDIDVFWLAGIVLRSAFVDGLGWAGGVVGSCLIALPALRVADILPGSLTGAWTGRELLVLANLTGSAPSTSPGPSQDKGGAPHLVGLRFDR